ncbi:MAG TPA: hypothetical protein VFN22_12270 [Gemmatimonadales bacterium]|nr:hypothetical protein [Gemmatimonadales bacterium]
MTATATAVLAVPVQAQIVVEARGGINVPTFDIRDAVKAGPSFGAGLSTRIGDRLWVIADADFGSHNGADVAGGASGPDIMVSHYIAKLGYRVAGSGTRGVQVILNAGVGAMRFAVDNGPSFTYPAINVGAKVIYPIGSMASFVLSPQGDIAFSKTEEVGTSNAWVWPFAAGFRLQF